MAEVVVFAGTSEGRILSEWLCRHGIIHHVCVATEYGEQVLNPHPCALVHRGRMGEEEMRAFLEEKGASLVIDATHPYAVEVTANLKMACGEGRRYLRLLREDREETETACRWFGDAAACARYLKDTDGGVFLTTGSKELSVFAEDPTLRSRLTVRILPGRESLSLAESCGLPGKQIIAMQGPFRQELNKALFEASKAKYMVTKASGRAGGFQEKLLAAAELGMEICVIGRPSQEAGLTMEALQSLLAEALLSEALPSEKQAEAENKPDRAAKSDAAKLDGGELDAAAKPELPLIALIGCGTGRRDSMTLEALQALDRAGLVFGAGRLLSDLQISVEQFPYYMAKDILPCIRQKQEQGYQGDIALLYSGDTGFYSGATGMIRALEAALGEGLIQGRMQVFPGISSISRTAALLGESWEDASLLSIHGRGDRSKWAQQVLASVKENRKTALLISGLSDLHEVAALLQDIPCTICGAYQLGSPNQEVFRLSPGQCLERKEEGLYTLLIQNEKPAKRKLTQGISDDAFLRDRVPMTKEEVRTVSIARLQLQRDAVVYDIGSGTGSVAVEIAALDPSLRVYAIERKVEALELICRNLQQFSLHNAFPVEGTAPEALEALPLPTHVFIGGSGGRMRDILTGLLQKAEDIRVVINAVSFETLQELLEIPQHFVVEEYDITTLSAVRSRAVGSYHLQQAQNPVWICSFRLLGGR